MKKNGKPFKTREGNLIKLTYLLDKSLEKARLLIIKKNPQINVNELEELAEIISIGAIKYADLSKNRIINYVFDWNNILNFEGNTALYIQYAYVRINSILFNYKFKEKKIKEKILLNNEKEKKLGILLLQLEESIFKTAKYGMPHILCDYLYNLAVHFSNFYECCPILLTNDKTEKYSRIQLAYLTAKTLKKGLNLLGIETTKKM